MQQNPYLDADDDQTTQYITQEPTAAYARPAADAPQAVGRASTPQEAQEKKPEGIAMAPVIGSALAAATSLLLTSRIGVGGAVVTAAVGAAVTTLTSQIYTRLASASAEKLRNVASGPSRSQLAGVMDSSELDGGYAQGSYGQAYAPDPSQAATYYSDGTRVAPAELRQAAAKRHTSRARKRGIIVTVIIALVTVLVAAGIVGLATAGEGIGPKTQPIIATTTSDENANKDAQSATTQNQTATTGSTAATDTTKDSGTASDSTSKDGTSTNASTSSNSSASTSNSTSGGGQNSSTGTSSDSGNADADTGNSSSNSASSGAADSGATSAGTSGNSNASGDPTATTQSANASTASGN